MKKFSLVSPDQIRNHLANTSPSRLTHRFSKSRRFSEANPECKQACYNSTSSLSKRKTSIGYGEKFDFTKSTVLSPSPSTYEAQSSFNKKRSAHAFGISREKSPERSYLYHFQKAKNPGPGTYENQVKTRNMISYTHRPRTLDVVAKHLSYLQVPGPGMYESPQLNPKDGKYKLSKYNDSKLSIINRDRRFKREKEIQISPGPVVYETIDHFSDKGKYIVSKRKGQGTRPFDRQRKFTISYWKTDANPAPGSYSKPSDFGVYGDLNYYRSLMLSTK